MDTKLWGVMVCLTFVVAFVSGAEKKAKCEIKENSGSAAISGTIMFEKKGDKVMIKLDLSGFTGNVSDKHGFHVHQEGNITRSCLGALGHYNPTGKTHGAPTDSVRHVGDLGNIEEQDEGKIEIEFEDEIIELEGDYSIIGRSIVVHAKADDLGKGGDASSLANGNAGSRMGCCVIEEYKDDSGPTDAADVVTRSALVIVTSTLLAVFVSWM